MSEHNHVALPIIKLYPSAFASQDASSSRAWPPAIVTLGVFPHGPHLCSLYTPRAATIMAAELVLELRRSSWEHTAARQWPVWCGVKEHFTVSVSVLQRARLSGVPVDTFCGWFQFGITYDID
jgi:hypothetical protein